MTSIAARQMPCSKGFGGKRRSRLRHRKKKKKKRERGRKLIEQFGAGKGSRAILSASTR